MVSIQFATMILGLVLAVIGGLWTLFGAFRSNRLLGWLYVLSPGGLKIFAAACWAILHWEEAKRPVTIQLVGLALMAFAELM